MKCQTISAFPGNLKADAVLLQCFLFEIPPAPDSQWEGLTKDAGDASCSFVV